MTDISLVERRRLALPACKGRLPGRETVPPAEFMRALLAETASLADSG
jgi:hypothetical protein